MKSFLLFNILIISFLLSCNQENINKIKGFQNESDTFRKVISSEDSIRIKEEENFIRSNFIIGQKYTIQGNFIIHKNPNPNSEKLINKKATEIFDKTIYACVDQSTRVVIEDIKGLWAKVKVVEPEWLSETHEGWIMAENIIGENKTDRFFIESLNKLFLISLISNIDSNQYIDSILRKLNFHEEYRGLYRSNEEFRNKAKHIIDVNNYTKLVVLHSSDSIFWKKITTELKGIHKYEVFEEGSCWGKRYFDGKFTFETLIPKNGIVVDKNVFYDLYIYKTKKYKQENRYITLKNYIKQNETQLNF